MDLTRFSCFAGTSRGFLLTLGEKPKDIKHVKPEASSEVTALAFSKDQNTIFVGFKNGAIQPYDPLLNEFKETISDLSGKGSVVGLGFTEKGLLAGKADGTVNIWSGKKNEHFNLSIGNEGTLDCLVLNENRNCFGTGGEKNDLKLWDIETQQCIFKAKSMGHDKLNLPIPTSIRGITFFPEDPHLSCCCTKEGHVLLYDDRKQRRPVVKFLEPKASYTTIACAYRDRQCLVGTTKGYMQLLDMKAGKCMKTFTSFTGSVSSIVCDPLEPYVFSASLDRYLRVHNLETKELLHKVYMKINLTSLLIKPVVKEEKEEPAEKIKDKGTIFGNDEADEDIDEEYENIFSNMEVICEKLKKKNKNKRQIEEKQMQLPVKKSKKLKLNTDQEKIKAKRKTKTNEV
ncbi:WD repeat-containing protein 74 [Diabrotica virgifera virgifera]|uniref:WD repeat-containing protein 74 n=1 Tax=Diabrotica virgifera virgifera TaxID=50390 RepID=A0A6P7F5R7_DIAVI|nr:WD repeat-containing protein 74 [Diabrotica virgifera virgifera]